MNNKYFLCFTLLFTAAVLHAQPYLEWDAQYTSASPLGIDRGNVITNDVDGNVYVAGKVQGNVNFDYITIKYDKNGQTKWVKTYNGTGNGDDEINAIYVDGNSNVIVTGQSFGGSNSDIVTIKYDSTGNEIFLKRYDNSVSFEAGISLITDNFGNIFVGGTSNAYAILLKYNNSGDLQWNKNLDSGVCNKLAINNLNNLIACNSVGLQYAYEIYELNISSGQLLYTYNTNSNYNARDRGIVDKIVCDQSNNFYVLATADNLINNVAPVIANFTKYSHFVGLESWEHEIQDYRVQGKDIIIDDSLNTYFLVERTNVNGREKSYIAKISTNGNFIWGIDYQSNINLDYTPNKLAISTNFNGTEEYLIYTSSDSNGSLNLNSVSILNGSVLSTKLYTCAPQRTVISNDSNSDRCKNLYITGYSNCNNTSQDIITLKYSTILKPKITPSKQNPICENEAIILYADTCSTCTYLWSNGGTADSILLSPDTTTEYHIVVSNADSCMVTSLPYKVIVKPRLVPSVNITSSSTSICIGNSVTLTAHPTNGGTAPVYQWFLNGVLQNGSNSTFTLSPTLNAQVNGIMTTSEQCYTQLTANSNLIPITVNPLPIAAITPKDSTTFCHGNEVILKANNASMYHWNNNATSDSLIVTESGSFKVTITDGNGCTGISNTIAVTVNPTPTPTITPSGNTTFCFGGSVTLTSSNAASYSWNTTETAQFINVDTSGLYTVTVVDTNGCSGSSSPTQVTVNNVLAVDIIANGDLQICQGETITLSSSVVGNLYAWSNNASTPSITVPTGGQYTLSVTDANGCTGISDPISVVVYSLPQATLDTIGLTTFCKGGSVSLCSNPASAYLWNTGATSQTINITESGNFKVTITDIHGCKNESASTAILVHPLPLATILPAGNIRICKGKSILITASGGNTYLWNTAAITSGITVIEAGAYWATVTDNHNCSSITTTTTLQIDTLPKIGLVLSGPATFCEGASVTITANNANSYLWSNGAVTQSLIVTYAGSYSVIGTNSQGCSNSSDTISTTVLFLQTPKIEISTPNTSVCEGDEVTFTTAISHGGASPKYQWYVNNTLQSETASTFKISTLTNGSNIHSILTSNAPCLTLPTDKSNTVTIAVNPLKTPSITIMQVNDVNYECEEALFNVNVTNEGSNPVYRWYVNDILTSTGKEFNSDELKDGVYIYCKLISNAKCLTQTEVTSPVFQVSVINKELPLIKISNGIILSTNYDTPNFIYAWYHNDVLVSNASTINCSDFGTGEYRLIIKINKCELPSLTLNINNCTVASIDIESENKIALYPNPTNGKLTITSKSIPTHNLMISVTNVYGNLIYSGIIQPSNTEVMAVLDFSQYANGIYFVKIGDANIRKVVKAE